MIDAAARQAQVSRALAPHYMHLALPDKAALASAIDHWAQTTSPTIPRRIHQIWIGPRRPPWQWIDTFRVAFSQTYPAWEYKLWREPEIAELELVNREHYQVESTFYGKADILRYELLHQFGGIYIDADMRWLEKPLDPLRLLAGECGMFAAWENQWDLANSVIGCAPQHPLMRLVVQTLNATFRTLRLEQCQAPFVATGPRFLSEVVNDLPLTRYPMHYFYPQFWHGISPDVDTSQFPASYMIQYGYSTNRLEDRHEQFT